MTSWPSGGARPGVLTTAKIWFSPHRWAQNELIIAVVAIVLAISPFVPWYRATVRFKTSSMAGFLMDPPGSVSGVTVHSFLWVVVALALLEFAVLAARYAPGRPRTLPGYRLVLVVTSALILIAVGAGFILRPAHWWGGLQLGDGMYLTVSWSYGAVAAVFAAIASLGIAIVMIRER